jgi:AcrR family transcriptional regulator
MSPKVDEQYKENRRREILGAARQVFASKGFEPATMKDVVEASGMSRGFVYSYFDSTEAMLRALLDEMDSELPDPQMLFEGTSHAWEAVERLLQFFEESFGGEDDGFMLVVMEYFFSGWRHRERRLLLEDRFDNAVRFYTAIFERGVRQGDFHPRAPLEDIARTLVTFIDGGILASMHLGKEKSGVLQQMKLVKEFLRNVLQA